MVIRVLYEGLGVESSASCLEDPVAHYVQLSEHNMEDSRWGGLAKRPAQTQYS